MGQSGLYVIDKLCNENEGEEVNDRVIEVTRPEVTRPRLKAGQVSGLEGEHEHGLLTI